MQDRDALILEIIVQDSRLSMNLSGHRHITQTVKSYAESPYNSQEIDSLCREIEVVLEKSSTSRLPRPELLPALKKSGRLLWDQLLARSVKEALLPQAASSLVLAMDEQLIHIPWELLYDGKDFFCLKFNLGRVVRAKEQGRLPRYRNPQGLHKALVLADLTADLKSAYLEGIDIRDQMDRRRNDIWVDFKSTFIDTLYVKKNICDYDIVHFAGHCEYAPGAKTDAGWILSDGRFSARDILSLGESLSLPSLVFANACCSAQVDRMIPASDYQQKAYGLAAAFLFAGVRLYIGSVLCLRDESSLAFAREFYNCLLKGWPVGECVRNGRLKLEAKYGLDSLSWLNYVLYGDPNFSFFSRPEVNPAARLRKRMALCLPWVKRILCAAAVIIPTAYICLWLPSLRPDSYFLLRGAQRSLGRGMNEQAILSCRRIIDKDPAFLAVYPLLAEACKRQGMRQEAMKYYLDYSAYSEKRQDKKNLSMAYVGIGWLYQDDGDYPKAFDFYNKAVLLSRQNRDKLNEAIALRRLAVWHLDKEENDKALELLLKSSEINRAHQRLPGYRYNLACDYFDLGLAFANKNDLVTAKEFYQKSQRIFEKLKMRHELSDYYFNLGEIYLLEKDYHRTLDCYMRGLKIDQAQANKPNIAGDYNMLGELYAEMGNPDEAERYFLKSISLYQEIASRPELAAACANLAVLYKQKRRFSKAREYFRQAQEIYWQIDPGSYKKIRQALLDLDNPS